MQPALIGSESTIELSPMTLPPVELPPTAMPSAVLPSATLPPVALPPMELPPAQLQALRALLTLAAVRPDQRQSWALVAHTAGLGRNSNLVKRIAADLRRRKLIRTKPGPHGGVWLTPLGRRLASD